MRILIKNTTAYLGSDFGRKEGVDLLVEGDLISAVGKNLPPEVDQIVDGQDFFVTPGFINAHFHPSQQLNRAVKIGVSHASQMRFLHSTYKAKLAEDKIYLSQIAVLEGLKAGTTCFYSVGSEIESQVKVYQALGVRAACTLIPKDIVEKNEGDQLGAKVWETEERLDKAEELHLAHHGQLVRVHFGACNVKYCSDQLLLGMLALAEKYDTGFHMHAAESEGYVSSVRARTGQRPIEHLEKIGALNRRVSLAHAVQVTDREIEFIAKSKANIVHCPRANSYVGVGFCPVSKFLKAGVNIALASDAAINNNSNEVRSEARAVFDRLIYEGLEPSEIDYLSLFRMLTENGARAMNLEKQLGTIEPGKKADLVLWSKNNLPFIPGHNHLADLIFNDSCLAHTVFIGGRKVLEDGRSLLIDEEQLISKSREISENYRQQLLDPE